MTVYEQMDETIDHILENEALTDELDDPAAKKLLTWGIKLITTIRGDEDDDDETLLDTSNEESIILGLRTIPALLKLINQWLSTDTQNDETNQAKFSEALEKMRIIKGEEFQIPSPRKSKSFLQQLAKPNLKPTEKIKLLIQLF